MTTKRAIISFTVLAMGFGISKPLAAVPAGEGQQVASSASNPFPEGKGKALVLSKCMLCHTQERIVATPRTKKEWQDIVKRMWDERAPFSDNDIPTISDYLFKSFGKPDTVYPLQVSMPIPDGYDFKRPVKRGVITGTVIADNGPVHTFSVEVHNLLYRMRYYVYTDKGRYTLPQALPGPYEIIPYEANYKGPSQKVTLGEGDTQTVNLSVTYTPPKEEPGVVYVDPDKVYPPGPGHDLYMSTCHGCHVSDPFHATMQLSEYGYRMSIDYMRWGKRTPAGYGSTPLGRTQLSTAQTDLIGHYLGSLFDPNMVRKMRRPDYPLDEEVVSKAIFVEYDLPDEIVNSHPGDLGFHDAFVASDGSVWFGISTWTSGKTFIVRLNPKELDPQKRMKFFYAPPGENFRANGIGEDKLRHQIYFSDALNGRLGEVDTDSDTLKFHNIPYAGYPHGMIGDPKGNIWFSMLTGSSLDKYDPRTGQAYSYPTITEDTGAYAVVEDHDGNMWVPGSANNIISKFDLKTQTMTEYKTPTIGSGVRRGRVDSKGNIWFSESAVGAFAMIVPKTGKITEYKLPIRNIEPYSIWVDNKDEDIIWATDFMNGIYFHDYGWSPFSYNTKTQRMYYYPAPRGTFGSETFTEPNNTVWSTTKNSPTKGVAIHFYPNGYTPDAPPM